MNLQRTMFGTMRPTIQTLQKSRWIPLYKDRSWKMQMHSLQSLSSMLLKKLGKQKIKSKNSQDCTALDDSSAIGKRQNLMRHNATTPHGQNSLQKCRDTTSPLKTSLSKTFISDHCARDRRKPHGILQSCRTRIKTL